MKTNRLLYRVLWFYLFLICMVVQLSADSGASSESEELYHYVCLASFSVPANAALFRQELAASGVETITERLRIQRRPYTRVLYRKAYTEFRDARKQLDTLRNHPVLVAHQADTLWIRSGVPIEEPAQDSLLAAKRVEDDPGLMTSMESPEVEKPAPAPPSRSPSKQDKLAASTRTPESPEPDRPVQLTSDPPAPGPEPSLPAPFQAGSEPALSGGPGIEDMTSIDPAPGEGTAEKQSAPSRKQLPEEKSAPAVKKASPDSVPEKAVKSGTAPPESEEPDDPAPPEERAGASAAEELRSDPDNPYKLLHPEGYANAVFATEPIGLGEEDTHELKNHFTYPRPVFARCYLPGPVGEVSGEDFWHEIWINGKLQGRTFFNEPPEPSWDQIQIWITEDEYSTQMRELGSGEHQVIIWVMKNEYQGERAVAGENAAGDIVAEMKEIWVPVRLSRGSFTYVKP